MARRRRRQRPDDPFAFVSDEQRRAADRFLADLLGRPAPVRLRPGLRSESTPALALGPRVPLVPIPRPAADPSDPNGNDDATDEALVVVDEDLEPLTAGEYAFHQGTVTERGRLDARGRAALGRIDPARPFRFEIRDRVCVIRDGAFFDPDDASIEYGGTWFDWTIVRDDRQASTQFWPHYHREMDAAITPGIDRLAQHEHLTRRPITVAAPFQSRLDRVRIRATPVQIRVGPLVRYADHERAVIWLETETPALVRVRHRPDGETATTSAHASTVRVGGRHYAAVELTGLSEHTRYLYTVDVAPLPATGPIPVEPAAVAEAFPELTAPVRASMQAQLSEVSLHGGPWLELRTLRRRYDQQLRFATGSCRMHPGDAQAGTDLEPDMLDALGSWLRTSSRDKWPDFALYTGDQIYSDEVADDHAERLRQGRFGARVPGPADPSARARDKLVDGAWAGRFAHRFAPYRDPPVQQVEAVRRALAQLDEIHRRYPDIKGIYLEYPEADPREKLKWRLRTLEGRRQVSGASTPARDEQKAREAVALLPKVDALEISSEPFRVFLPQWKTGFDIGLRRNPMRMRHLCRNLLLWSIPDFERQLPTLTDRGLATVVRGPDQHGHPAAAGGRHCADFSEYAYFYERAFTTTHNVRALLAHVPTFLIFDDHELTDDWNGSVAWVRMLHNPKDELGMWPKTLTDGLAAYWVYQGWGNKAPSQWPARDPRAAALRQAQREGTDALPRLRRVIFDACFGQVPAAGPDAVHQSGLSLDWHYALPFDPPFLVPDCRSRRRMFASDEDLRVIEHGDAKKRPKSQTIDAAQLAWMRQQLVDRGPSGPVAFVATSTPLLMQKKVMQLMLAPETTAKAWAGGVDLASIGAALASSRTLGIASDALVQLFRRRKDLEHMIRDRSWRDLWALVDAMRQAQSPIKSLVFVSGDVHHNYCMTANLSGQGRPQPELVQVTCSGLKTDIRGDFKKSLAEVQGSDSFSIGPRRLTAGFLAKGGKGGANDLVLYQNAAALVTVRMGAEVDLRVDFLSSDRPDYHQDPQVHVYRYSSGPGYQPLSARSRGLDR